jgi:hypothetical protein
MLKEPRNQAEEFAKHRVEFPSTACRLIRADDTLLVISRLKLLADFPQYKSRH